MNMPRAIMAPPGPNRVKEEEIETEIMKNCEFSEEIEVTLVCIKNGMITITKQPNKIERKQPKSPRKNPTPKQKTREN